MQFSAKQTWVQGAIVFNLSVMNYSIKAYAVYAKNWAAGQWLQ